jgi:hypothetical protein
MRFRPTRSTDVASTTSPDSESGLFQRKCACGNHTTAGGECAECGKRRGVLQRGGAGQSSVSQVPPLVHEVLSSPGRQLDAAAKTFFEPQFGQDFSAVRVHTDAKAVESARAVNARAYTVGQDVVFGAGQYRPDTNEGRRILSHELTHVLQQRSFRATPSTPITIAGESDRMWEDEARRASSLPGLLPSQAFSLGGARRLLQKFDSPEHVLLGETSGGAATGFILLECHQTDLPQRLQPVNTWPPEWQRLWALPTTTAEQKRFLTKGLTYGEVVALSGDFYPDFNSLNTAPLREIFDLIPLIRGKATTTQLQQATGGRYLALAQQNESHFTNVRPGHRNIDVWRERHMQAIQTARQKNSNLAWAINGGADHFLTDAFSGGHIRTPRDKLMGSASKQIEAKVLHDLDNEHGVEVTNDRGDPPWIAYGDTMLSDPRNAKSRLVAEEAVRLSKKDVADALSQGNAYPAPTPATVYAAEKLVPRPVNPSADRWTGRIPTYVLAPGGTAVRQADDYTMTHDRIIQQEAPGIIAGFSNDDDQIRDWVARHQLPAIGRQSQGEKIRMINTLLDGYVEDVDLDAIEKLCNSVTSGGEMNAIRNAINPRVTSLSSLGQRTRLRVILSRNP